MQYPIAIFQQNNSYHVSIPDIEHLSVVDSSMADAIANARLAVMRHLHRLMQDDQPLPEPSAITAHLHKPQYAGYIWAVVSVELSRLIGETVEVTLQLPKQLLAQVTQQFKDESLDNIMLLALKHYLKSQTTA